jgi:hypothetical protein
MANDEHVAMLKKGVKVWTPTSVQTSARRSSAKLA